MVDGNCIHTDHFTAGFLMNPDSYLNEKFVFIIKILSQYNF